MIQEVGVGVFRFRYPTLDENVGVVVGDEGVLIVDTRSTHAQGDEILADLARVTDLAVAWVVNTHWHWDHVFGNSRFPGAEIWGHDRTSETLTSRPDEMKADALEWLGDTAREEIATVEIVPPQRTLSERATLDIGRTVELSYHGLGHTDADIRVVISDGSVVFLGDLIEEGGPPAFDDSFPLEWPATLAGAIADLESVVVPGHGDIVDREYVLGQQEELAEVADLAVQCLAGEIGTKRMIASGPYPAEVMTTALDRARVTGAPSG